MFPSCPWYRCSIGGTVLMRNRWGAALVLGLVCAIATGVGTRQTLSLAQAPKAPAALAPEVLREWLTYLSSDDLEGRNTFSEGLGLAAAYIADQLKTAGVRPGGDHGSYFQRVSVLGVRTVNRSTLTIEVNGQ